MVQIYCKFFYWVAFKCNHISQKREALIEIYPETDRYRESLNLDSRKLEVGAQLVAEYLARTDRLAPLFPKLHTVRTRPLPENLLQDCRLAYETPQNLALELSKSILYDNTDSIDLKTLKSLTSHGDASLWGGKPQQYFESISAAADDGLHVNEFDDDSLAP